MTATAHALFVAAGTLATARLVREALHLVDEPAPLLSNPAAGFLLWFPAWFGAGPERTFGLSQLSLALARSDASPEAFGYLFSTAGLPVNEFLDHVPVPRRFAIDLLKYLLPSSLVGNVFLPGALPNHRIRLNAYGRLVVSGGFSDVVPAAIADVRQRLARFRKLGGWLPARGFVLGQRRQTCSIDDEDSTRSGDFAEAVRLAGPRSLPHRNAAGVMHVRTR